MFLQESAKEYFEESSAEAILESLIEFQESFEATKYEIIQLEYEKAMLESSQEYLEEAALLEAEEAKPEEEKAAPDASKTTFKDKAANMGKSIKEGGTKMIEALITFAKNLMAKIKGAFFALIAKGEKSWDKLAEETSKKPTVNIVKDANFGKDVLTKINGGNVEDALKSVSELKGTKSELPGSTASSLITARKNMIFSNMKSLNGLAEKAIKAVEAKINAEKGKEQKDGAAISGLKKELSDIGMMFSKKVSAMNQLNVKLYSASK